jgi:superoxide dismutase, Cu-Zn family
MQAGGDRSGRRWRRSTSVAVGAVLVLLPIGHPDRELGRPTPVAWYSNPKPVVVFGSGTLTMPNRTSKAITYDPDLAPIGAAMTATIIPTSEGSTAQLTVLGLLPDRGYTVSAYEKACGATPGAAGARFQYHLYPAASSAASSADPEYINPDNEIWLDVRTDDAGTGTSATTIPFVLTDRVPHSFVVHDRMHTPEDPAHAAGLGTRIACLTLSPR